MRYSGGMGGTPPTGQVEENRSQIENLKKEAPLYSMIPRVKIGGDGLPRWQPQNEEEQELQRLSDVETFKMQLSAPLYSKALHEIGSVHNPTRDDLEAYFSAALVPAMPRLLADALMRYWAEDYEGCVYLLAPKIETMLRALARAVAEPVYQVQRNSTPGKYVGVGVLLQTLRKRGLDESWSRYLFTMLSSPMGWNLRNELAHGFIDAVPGPMAALVIQAALYIATLVPREDDSGSDGVAEAAPV